MSDHQRDPDKDEKDLILLLIIFFILPCVIVGLVILIFNLIEKIQ